MLQIRMIRTFVLNIWVFASFTLSKEKYSARIIDKNIFTIDMVTLMRCNYIENILKIDLVVCIHCQNKTCLKSSLISYAQIPLKISNWYILPVFRYNISYDKDDLISKSWRDRKPQGQFFSWLSFIFFVRIVLW